MKAPWFIDGVTTDTSGDGPSSGSTLRHCSRRAAQLPKERDLRPGRIAGPEQTQAETGEAVSVTVPADEARIERRRRRPENVPHPGHETELPPVAPFEPEIAPVLPHEWAPPDPPVVRDGIVACVVDRLDTKAGKRLRPRVHGRAQLGAAAASERALPADPAPYRPAKRLVPEVELPRAIDDADVVREARQELAELRGERRGHRLVRIHEEQPVVGRLVDELHPRALGDRHPLVTEDAGTVSPRDSLGVIVARDVDHEHLVAERERWEAALEQARLVVTRDHRRDRRKRLRTSAGIHEGAV